MKRNNIVLVGLGLFVVIQIVLFLISGLISGGAQPKESETSAPLGLFGSVRPISCDITANGAIPDDEIDDRAAIQATIDACDSTFVPRGTYMISRSGSNFYGLRLISGKRLHGSNYMVSTLKQTPGIANSVRLIYVDGSDIVVEGLTLDGNRANQTVQEHRHGLFIQNSTNVIVRDVRAQEFTGDGFYLYLNNNNLSFDAVHGLSNTRNGLSLGASSTQVMVRGSFFRRNNAQQIDSEPGGTQVVQKITITGNVMDDEGQSPNGIALTLSGDTALTPLGHEWTVSNNIINGSVIAFQIYGATITGNVSTNATTNPCMKFRDRVERIVYANNFCKLTQYVSAGAVQVLGTTASNIVSDIIISGNIIDTSSVADARQFGIAASGAVGALAIRNNLLIGPGVTDAATSHAGSGIYLRATVTGTSFRWAQITGNYVRNFGRYGVSVWGGGSGNLARFNMLDVTDNYFDDTSSPTAAQVMGVSLNLDGHSAAENYRTTGNLKFGNVVTLVGNCPGGGCNNL